VRRDRLVNPGALREPAHDPAGGVSVEAASVGSGKQRPVGAFTDGRIDRSSGAWR
jgi:hypothetical protein